MSRKHYPLELILTAHGTAELVDVDENILWASDDDDDFKEEFEDFLTEEDFDNVLDFLREAEIITEGEYQKFHNEEWEMIVESLDGADVADIEDEEDDEEDS